MMALPQQSTRGQRDTQPRQKATGCDKVGASSEILPLLLIFTLLNPQYLNPSANQVSTKRARSVHVFQISEVEHRDLTLLKAASRAHHFALSAAPICRSPAPKEGRERIEEEEERTLISEISQVIVDPRRTKAWRRSRDRTESAGRPIRFDCLREISISPSRKGASKVGEIWPAMALGPWGCLSRGQNALSSVVRSIHGRGHHRL